MALGTAALFPIAVATLSPSAAIAQDYTSGTLTGTVTNADGSPIVGAAVSVLSTEQGVTRSATTDGSGRFRLPLIPLGGYTVTIASDGYDTVSQTATVTLGGQSSYDFVLSTGNATNIDDVVVTSARQTLDFNQTTTGLVIDLQELVKTVPLARSVTAIAMLAPSVVQGDSAFGDVPSIGGSSVAENAYYVNGLNITNFDTYIGGNTVPFDFYRFIEVKTGGIPAEFGRATGGITNATTKSGTNDFMFGLHGNWAPDELRSIAPDTSTSFNAGQTSDSYSLIAEAGGPLIRDRLFAYGLVQLNDSQVFTPGRTSGYAVYSEADSPFYGLKIDGYITEKHRLEGTWFQTNGETRYYTATYDYPTRTVGPKPDTYNAQKSGGQNYVFRYTGNFTDWLTFSTAFGRAENTNAYVPSGSEYSYASDSRGSASGISPRTAFRVSPNQTATTTVSPNNTARDFYRADIDLLFSFFGDHHVRAGYELEDLLMNKSTVSTGKDEVQYTYLRAGRTSSLIRGTSNLSAGQEYVRVSHYKVGGSFKSRNQALYVQDSWDFNDQLTFNIGLRVDRFSNYAADGAEYLTFDHEIGPRLGFTFDPLNDGRSRIFGSYNRYYLPVASNTAYRMAASELFYSEYFLLGSYTQVPVGTYGGSTGNIEQVNGQTVTAAKPYDANGAPLQRGAQIVNWTGAVACPSGGFGTAGVLGCAVTSRGTVPPTDSLIARDLKSTAEDEWILGYERKVGDLWTFSAVASYRDLLRNAEDVAIDAAVNKYCVANRIAGCAAIYDGFHQYVIVNPGQAAKITLSSILPGDTAVRTIDFSAADLGYPEAKREYRALELSFKRAFDGLWSLNGSWTLSKSNGNTEGYVKSDNGQADAGITQDFDQPGLTDGSDGLLPNHHGHVFKLFGSYALTPDLTFGVNASVTSPRHFGCLGVHPTDEYAKVYGASSYYCNGKLTPRGTQLESEWIKKVDVSVRYTVPENFVPGNLVLRADIFNIFDYDGVTDLDEFGEFGDGSTNPNYGKPVSYQTPRYIRIGFDLTF